MEAIDLLTDFVGRPKIDAGRARPRARRRHPGDPALQGPALRRGRAPDRPRGIRRPPARAAPCWAPRSTCARSPATRSSPSASAAGRAGAAARSSSATSTTCPRTASVDELFGRFPDAPRPTAYEPAPRVRSRTCWSSERDSNQSHLRMSYRPRDRRRATRKARAAFTIYSTLLGGSMGSRLFDEIREQRGLCYSVYAVDHAFADVPILQLGAGLESGKCRRGLHAHARDRRRAARRRAQARRRSSAPAPTPPAAACWRSRTRTRWPATRRTRRSCSARTSTRTRRSPRSTRSPSTRSREIAATVDPDGLAVACVGPHTSDEF